MARLYLKKSLHSPKYCQACLCIFYLPIQYWYMLTAFKKIKKYICLPFITDTKWDATRPNKYVYCCYLLNKKYNWCKVDFLNIICIRFNPTFNSLFILGKSRLTMVLGGYLCVQHIQNLIIPQTFGFQSNILSLTQIFIFYIKSTYVCLCVLVLWFCWTRHKQVWSVIHLGSSIGTKCQHFCDIQGNSELFDFLWESLSLNLLHL